ncbi:MAG TPA: type II secretion system protein GspJ, partial [Phycisphaeraceae bacterium]
LAMMSVVAVSLYSSLRVGMTAQAAADRALQSARSMDAAAEAIQRDLQAAMPPSGLLAGQFLGESSLAADGNQADWMRFVTCTAVADITYEGVDLTGSDAAVVRDQPINSGLEQVEYALVEDASTGQRNLVRRVTRNLLAQEQPQPEETIIASGVRAMRLRYFDGSSWLTRWDSTTQDNRLPLAVELALLLEPPGAAAGSNAQPMTVVRLFEPMAAEADQTTRVLR